MERLLSTGPTPTHLINDEAVYRTAPGTPGMLNNATFNLNIESPTFLSIQGRNFKLCSLIFIRLPNQTGQPHKISVFGSVGCPRCEDGAGPRQKSSCFRVPAPSSLLQTVVFKPLGGDAVAFLQAPH